MKHGTLAALAALSLLTLVAAARAQIPAPQPPRYEVEILVFAHASFDPYEERFEIGPSELFRGAIEPPREAPVFDDLTFDPFAPVPTEPPAPPPALPEPVEPSTLEPALPPPEDPLLVRPLRPEELKLGSEYRRLRAVAAYTPLLHAGWVQPGLPEGEARPFDLSSLGIVNPRGTVRVHLSRFLHVTLDLTYFGQAALAASPAGANELGELALAPRYRLATTRNVRSGELHYFDHPAFGVLVRVTPRVEEGAATGRRPAA